MKAIELLKYLEQLQAGGVDMDVDIDITVPDKENHCCYVEPIEHIDVLSSENRVGRWHTDAIRLSMSKLDDDVIHVIEFPAYYTDVDGDIRCIFDD